MTARRVIEIDGDKYESFGQDLSLPLDQLLDTKSEFYSQPWPNVITGAFAALGPHLREAAAANKPRLILANVPPFKVVINSTGAAVRWQRELYMHGELAFLRAGRKVFCINMMAGPYAQAIASLDVEPVSDSHKAELVRALEDEIIEALDREAARIGAPR